jgi:hypothetical protein
MGILTFGSESFEFLWASDVGFEGIRLEVYDRAGLHWFDVSVPDEGTVMVNTFAGEVPADLILAALNVARQRN